MRSSHSLDRLDTAFDDDRLVADAGLLLPATLAAHLGLRELVETHLDLGQAVGRANVGDKLLTLVMPRTEVATGQAAASSEDCRIERVSREWRASVDLAKPAAGRLDLERAQHSPV